MFLQEKITGELNIVFVVPCRLPPSNLNFNSF